MQNTDVALKVCKEYDCNTIKSALNDGFNLLGGLSKFIQPHQTVLIKPDLYHITEPNIARTTNPNIISALAELIDKLGAKCIIADSPKGNFSHNNLDNAYIKTQMLQASNNGHASLNLNNDISKIYNPKGVHCREIYIMDAINDADIIINVGKFRCENYLGLVGCSQNLFGLIPGKFKQLIKSRCHTLKSYYNYLIDLYEALDNKVVLNILDGIVSYEANNDPRILNSLLISANPYAIDATALKIINQQPEQSLLLTESVKRDKFNFNYTILGDNVESLVCSDFNYSVFKENVRAGSKASFKRDYNLRQKRAIIPSKLCKGCKVCVEACPMKAISVKTNEYGEYSSIDYSKCANCFKCIEACPYKIIKTKTPIKYRPIDKMIKKYSSNKK